VDDRAQVKLLRCERGKARVEIETHLVAEDAQRARTGAVVFASAFVANFSEQVEVLLHRRARAQVLRR